MTKTFKRANYAYEYYHDKIIREGVKFGDTKALFNVGFYLENPMENTIENEERGWNLTYAKAEWSWYLSGDRNIKKLGKIYGKVPEIWKRMADVDGKVNSNYGWQWRRNDQYQFSKLQHYIWGKLDAGIELGTYFHFAHNLHLYNDKI